MASLGMVSLLGKTAVESKFSLSVIYTRRKQKEKENKNKKKKYHNKLTTFQHIFGRVQP